MIEVNEQSLNSFYGNVDVRHSTVGYIVDVWEIRQVFLGEENWSFKIIGFSLFLVKIWSTFLHLMNFQESFVGSALRSFLVKSWCAFLFSFCVNEGKFVISL